MNCLIRSILRTNLFGTPSAAGKDVKINKLLLNGFPPGARGNDKECGFSEPKSNVH